MTFKDLSVTFPYLPLPDPLPELHNLIFKGLKYYVPISIIFCQIFEQSQLKG